MQEVYDIDRPRARNLEDLRNLREQMFHIHEVILSNERLEECFKHINEKQLDKEMCNKFIINWL